MLALEQRVMCVGNNRLGGGGGGGMKHKGGDWKTKSRVYLRNWPVRVKWAPFCNFRGPFLKKGGVLERGSPKKVFELIGTDCSMRKL